MATTETEKLLTDRQKDGQTHRGRDEEKVRERARERERASEQKREGGGGRGGGGGQTETWRVDMMERRRGGRERGRERRR